ncbi:MAG: methyltransferase domain-containing protein [Gammaproteobacteria bacterium]|jgi:SAM-dependent methyltransferase|nr:methyltransferase domain-containing protein [Gammaproteobacteria bacterium]
MHAVKTIRESETTCNLPEATPQEVMAARFYEDKFVPGLFKPWSPRVIAAADVGAGHEVLDIACGSGVVTRDIAAVTGSQHAPVGLDISPAMLTVARSLDASIDWRCGDACELPFADARFDRVVCQFGLMFFSDRVKALQEMLRVLKPGGRLAVVVWNSLLDNPGFNDLVEVLGRLAGANAAAALQAPFCLGDSNELQALAVQAGVRQLDFQTLAGEASFSGMFDFVDVELRGWLPVMNVNLDETQIRAIHQDCETSLARYQDGATGGFTLPTSAHVFSGTG